MRSARPSGSCGKTRDPSPSFRAKLILGVVCAGQMVFVVRPGVLPMSSLGGVAVEAEDVAELVLDRCGVGEHAMRAGRPRSPL